MAAREAGFDKDTVLLECVRSVWVPSKAVYVIAGILGVCCAASSTRWPAISASLSTCAVLRIGRSLENYAYGVDQETRDDMRATQRGMYVLASAAAIAASLSASHALNTLF